MTIVDVDIPKKSLRMSERNIMGSTFHSDNDEPIDIQPIQEKPCFALSILTPKLPEERRKLHDKRLEEREIRMKKSRVKYISDSSDSLKKDKEMSKDSSQATVMHLRDNLRKLRFDQSLIHQWGVYTTEPIRKNEAIIEYIGEIIRLRVADKRQVQYEAEGNNGSYIFQLEKDKLIDATHKGGLARFINHSCDPNCATQVKNFDGQNHIIIYAKRDIQPYEELCYDYQMEYEPKDKRIQCLCGSPNCKKWLNWSEKAELELNYKWTNGAEHKRRFQSAPDSVEAESNESNESNESKESNKSSQTKSSDDQLLFIEQEIVNEEDIFDEKELINEKELIDENEYQDENENDESDEFEFYNRKRSYNKKGSRKSNKTSKSNKPSRSNSNNDNRQKQYRRKFINVENLMPNPATLAVNNQELPSTVKQEFPTTANPEIPVTIKQEGTLQIKQEIPVKIKQEGSLQIKQEIPAATKQANMQISYQQFFANIAKVNCYFNNNQFNKFLLQTYQMNSQSKNSKSNANPNAQLAPIFPQQFQQFQIPQNINAIPFFQMQQIQSSNSAPLNQGIAISSSKIVQNQTIQEKQSAPNNGQHPDAQNNNNFSDQLSSKEEKTDK